MMNLDTLPGLPVPNWELYREYVLVCIEQDEEIEEYVLAKYKASCFDITGVI